MLKIRLTRVGKKHNPLYRIVVTEHTNPVKGKFLEIVGNYNPKTKELVINKEKVKDWMSKGAQPSNTVAKFLVKEKIENKSVVVKEFHKAPKHTSETVEQPIEKTTEKTEQEETPSDTKSTEIQEETKSEESVETENSEQNKEN